MSDVFFYMYLVGLGLACGVGTVVLIGYLFIKRKKRKLKASRGF